MSNATIASHCAGQDGARVLIALDACPRSETQQGTEEKRTMIRRHFANLRDDRRYSGAVIVVAIEVGASPDLANDTGLYIEKYCDRDVFILKAQIKEPKWYGVVTTAEEKRNWTHHASELLEHDRLRVAHNFIGAGAMDLQFPELINEMSRWRRQLEVVNKNEEEKEQKTKEFYTGKPRPDDRCVATIACLWQAEVLRRNRGNAFHDLVRQRGLIYT